MYRLHYSNRCKKDIKKISKSAVLKMEELECVLNFLAQSKVLDAKYKNHKLQGDYSGCHECHIKPDVLLIYEIDTINKIVFLFRIGSHSDLFD